MTVPTALLFAFVLLLAGASGAAVLARLFRGDEADPDSRADAVLSFALPVGLVLAATPGWLLSVFFYVPIARLALPLALVDRPVAMTPMLLLRSTSRFTRTTAVASSVG